MLPLLAPSIGGASAEAPARLALIIGNGTYAYNDSLPNALSDAKKLADKLGSMGFAVESNTIDLGQERLHQTVLAFGDKLRASGQNTIGFFYYSGHAAQDTFGVNYLLPVDAKAQTPNAVRLVGTPLQLLIKAMEDTNNPINIIVLDACRDWFRHDRPRDQKDPRGLHDMGLHSSLLIAYATRSNDTAREGGNADSSPYSRRLLEALDQQANDPIVLLLDDVKGRVYSDTDAGQYPLLVDGLTVSGRWSMGSSVLSDVPDRPQPSGVQVATASFLAQLDKQKLMPFFRNKETFVDALLARRDVLARYEINTSTRLAYFLASIAHETGGFQLQEERFGFSAVALQKRWPREVVNQQVAANLAKQQPDVVASFVYANRFENGPAASRDGWNYRGRGLLFIVGKSNYRKYGDMIGVDLVGSPDLANDLGIGYSVAAAIWFSVKSNEAADADDLKTATIRFRGVYNNQRDRQLWLAQAKRTLGIAA